MIPQETNKQLRNEEQVISEINIKMKDESKNSSQNNFNKSEHSNAGQVESQSSKSSKSGENKAQQLDLGKQISQLIKIYSKEHRDDQLTLDQFKELAQDLFSMVDPRQLTNEELENLINLFEQKQKDPNKATAYKPRKTVITKEELKVKVIENKGSLGFFKNK